jgi:outer membrane protein assembly factor BamB
VIADGLLLRDTLLFVGSGRPEGRVEALTTRRLGRRVWRANTGNVSAPLAIVGGTLIVQTRSGTVLGLDPRTGTVRWRRRVGTGRAAPAAGDDGTFVVATLDSLFRLSAADGKVRARRRSPGPIVSGWRSAGTTLLAGTGDSLVIAVDRDSLSERWRARLDAPVLVAPAVVGDTIFAVSRVGTLYRIDAGSGETARIAALHWPVTAAPVAFDSLLLVGGADGTVRALRRDGGELWRLALWDPVPFAPLLLSDGIVAFGGNGDLKLLRP